MEFADFSSGYYEEEDSSLPEDLSQWFHEDQLPSTYPPSPPPEVHQDDSSLAFSWSVRKSKELLEKTLGYPASKLKYNHPHGLVILPLECFNCIRDYDSPPRNPIPHLLYLPPDDQTRLNHPEFQACLAAIYGDQEKPS